ncbi:MAG: hypothetical protein ACPLSM_02670, partial [Thermosphaera sp.]
QLYTYVPRIVSGGPEEALSGILYELLGLVAKLGFIGLVIYGGSVLLRNGFTCSWSYVELRKVFRNVRSLQSRVNNPIVFHLDRLDVSARDFRHRYFSLKRGDNRVGAY